MISGHNNEIPPIMASFQSVGVLANTGGRGSSSLKDIGIRGGGGFGNFGSGIKSET
jgi:hypothetical protein